MCSHRLRVFACSVCAQRLNIIEALKYLHIFLCFHVFCVEFKFKCVSITRLYTLSVSWNDPGEHWVIYNCLRVQIYEGFLYKKVFMINSPISSVWFSVWTVCGALNGYTCRPFLFLFIFYSQMSFFTVSFLEQWCYVTQLSENLCLWHLTLFLFFMLLSRVWTSAAHMLCVCVCLIFVCPCICLEEWELVE